MKCIFDKRFHCDFWDNWEDQDCENCIVETKKGLTFVDDQSEKEKCAVCGQEFELGEPHHHRCIVPDQSEKGEGK